MRLCSLESSALCVELGKMVFFSNSEEYPGVPINAAFVYVTVRTLWLEMGHHFPLSAGTGLWVYEKQKMRSIIQAPKSIILLSDNPDARSVFLANSSYQKCTSQVPYQPAHPRVDQEWMARWYLLESTLLWVHWQTPDAEHFTLPSSFFPPLPSPPLPSPLLSSPCLLFSSLPFSSYSWTLYNPCRPLINCVHVCVHERRERLNCMYKKIYKLTPISVMKGKF